MSRHENRFDRFQSAAVSSIVHDFTQNPTGRYLLVVPTGGGKTFTAVKALHAMFDNGRLDPLVDHVAWIAHRRELLTQAEEAFRLYESICPERISYISRLAFLMLSKVKMYMAQSPDTKLVVIDEAHHGAANSYQPVFERGDVGVLGLTATPTRHDGRQLEFERESFSIGFPDLVDLGVILRPNVERVEGGRYDISSIDDEEHLELLNNKRRNALIIKALLSQWKKYKKVVVYVGTRRHVKDLYEHMMTSRLRTHYDSIGWITGEGNSRSDERENFLRHERAHRRSILINVQVLSEGYDDPTINTVVMGAPTRSKLVYMQAMGRAIRHDPDDDLKKAYIVEVIDELPNIRYRIDNRWLYADISDALEPAVVDREFATETDLLSHVDTLCKEYQVPTEFMLQPVFKEHYRYSLLLFKVYKSPRKYFHYPIWITNDNRQAISNIFNFLSVRMKNYVAQETNANAAFQMVDYGEIDALTESRTRRYVFDAMGNAASEDLAVGLERPWITFVAFRLHRPESHLSPELVAFLEGMINRDEIMSSLLAGAYFPNAVLIRLPLPLSSFVGKIISDSEFDEVDAAINRLRQIKFLLGNADHRSDVNNVLQHAVIPLEAAYGPSLTTVAREDLAYSFKLT